MPTLFHYPIEVMDHKLAQETNTIERYLLNELTAPERREFEEHLFDCPNCAEQVNEDLSLIESLKEIWREESQKKVRAKGLSATRWFKWFQPMTFVPAMAALVLAVVAGYQNLVTIPALFRPQILETNPIVSSTRAATGAAIAIDRKAAMFNAAFDVDSPRVYPSYTCEFVRQDGHTVMKIACGSRTTAAFTLSLLLPAKQFPDGGYTMILRPAADAASEAGRFSFLVRSEGN